jgi:hypothetical protein
MGGGQPGNRQDNRQRGNAAQLLEKYKSMARDSQLAGDRVQSEYFLQFADHYYRVLSENRARFEDQRRQRGDELDEDEADEGLVETAEETAAESGQGEQRFEHRDRRERDRDRHFDREDRGREDAVERNGAGRGNGSDERIAVEALPPAIGREESAEIEEPDETVSRTRRRSRRPRPQEDEGEIAPAA